MISSIFHLSVHFQWQWNHNPVDTHWSLKERKGWLTLKALPADSLKLWQEYAHAKVVGYQSESTTLLTTSGNCFAGLFCSGKTFRGIGLCKDGIFLESQGQREVIQKGKYEKLWVHVNNDCQANRHQFSYSTDGIRFLQAGEAFPILAGCWEGIRVGLFCYGNKMATLLSTVSPRKCVSRYPLAMFQTRHYLVYPED